LGTRAGNLEVRIFTGCCKYIKDVDERIVTQFEGTCT
jgi:hypothetical protein